MMKAIPVFLTLSYVLLAPNLAQAHPRPQTIAPRSQTIIVKVWAGRSTAIDFSPINQKITSVVLADPSRVVYTADVPVQSGQASTLFLRQTEFIRFPGATSSNRTNLLVKTINQQGNQKLHSFEVAIAVGNPEYSIIESSRTAPQKWTHR
jgi:hypothetical protein